MSDVSQQMSQWNVLYTKPGLEKIVSKILSKKNIKNFLPTKKSTAPWWNINGAKSEILFSEILFVRTSHKDRTEIKQINGVVNFLYWHKNPAEIADSQITKIKLFMSTHRNVSVKKSSINMNYANESKNQMDMIVYSDDFKMEIPTLGYSMVAEGVSSNFAYIKTGRAKTNFR